MCDTLHLQGPQPRNEGIRAKDEHEAADDDAGAGKYGDDPAGCKEKEAHVVHGFKAKRHSTVRSFPAPHPLLTLSQTPDW